MIRQRVRIRFSKEGDLRLISHRDLARAVERMFRRSGLKLGMSEGFHPKARISFPSALALGVCGVDEIVEVELAEHVDAEQVLAALRPHAPTGLSIHRATVLDNGEKKAQVAGMVYEIPVPHQRREDARRAIDVLMQKSTLVVERDRGRTPVDVRAAVEHIELDDSMLRMRLLASRTASAQPRDVLKVLHLDDLEDAGAWLTRTVVEISS